MHWLELLVDKPPHRDKVSSMEGDEVGNIEAFIGELKNKKNKKKLEKEIREMRNEKLRNKNKKLKNLTNNY